MKRLFISLVAGALALAASITASAGWPMTDANPQITVSNGQQVGLAFTAIPLGGYGLALTHRDGSGQDWLGDPLDPNFDTTILGDPMKWNAWLVKMNAMYAVELPKVVKLDPPIAPDATPATVDQVRAWINQHTTFKLGADGYPIIVGK